MEKMLCDETWIYCYDPETKRQSPQWMHAGSPRPKNPDRANPPTNFWWSLFLTALAWSTCIGFLLDRKSTRNTMLRFKRSSGRDSVGRGQHSSNWVSGISTRTMHQSTTVVMRQLRRWKRLWRRSLTPSHKKTSMGPSRNCWNGTKNVLQLEEITSKGTRVSWVYYQ